MASAPLNWLLKIGGDALQTTAQTLCAAVNELNTKIGSSVLQTIAQTLSGAVNEINTKVGTTTLQTTAQNLSDAVNELNSGKSVVNINSSGTASASVIHKQSVTVDGVTTDIDGTSYMEQSVTLDASNPTIVTFTNAAITANSAIDVWCSMWDLVPDDVSTAAGTCAITYAADSDTPTITVRIYVR